MKMIVLAAGAAAMALTAGTAMAATKRHSSAAVASGPPQPIPYTQLDAYLKASPKQRMARNWWAGSDMAAGASTGTTANTAASTTAGSDVSGSGAAGSTPGANSSSGMSSGAGTSPSGSMSSGSMTPGASPSGAVNDTTGSTTPNPGASSTMPPNSAGAGTAGTAGTTGSTTGSTTTPPPR
jgi:hypothetical protein